MRELVDVFLCSCAMDDVRLGLFEATKARWKLERMAHLHILKPDMIPCTRKQFQGLRRPWIERHAVSPVYVMAEDDCMPWGPNFIERGLEVMANNPSWAVCSPLLLPYPEVPSMLENDDLYQGITCGGINFTRKGAMKDMQVPSHQLFDESSQAGWLARHGWKYGWMKKVKQLHLGACHSTIWPDSYTGITQINES